MMVCVSVDTAKPAENMSTSAKRGRERVGAHGYTLEAVRSTYSSGTCATLGLPYGCREFRARCAGTIEYSFHEAQTEDAESRTSMSIRLDHSSASSTIIAPHARLSSSRFLQRSPALRLGERSARVQECSFHSLRASPTRQHFHLPLFSSVHARRMIPPRRSP